MELQLRPRFFVLLIGALSIGVVIAASGCTTETPPLIPEDATVVAPDGSIPMRDGGPETMTCEVGLIDCEGTCTSVTADSLNCGSCGNACPSGVSCALGRCDCAAPMLGCDGLCVDPSSDVHHCGECGRNCATGETCLGGTCAVECAAPEVRCASSTAGGPAYACADVLTDPTNCGGCGTSCSGGAICDGGRCTCPTGQVSCSGVCTDLSTDANNCGACLNSCGADGVCMGGTCETCGTGLLACGSPARCADTAISRLHCGACDNTCGPGEGCNTGTCECLPGFTDCDGLCANLPGDPRNCGGCGIDCGYGGTCSAGVCTCAAGATMCGAECAELLTDAEHCGTCEVACGTDEACYEGDCLPVNDTCETARPVTGDVVINDEALSTGGSRPTGTNCGGGTGDKALYYAVTIPPGQEVAFVATTSGDLVVFEQAACGPTCARSSDFPESLTLSNLFGTSDVTRIVGVRAWSSSGTAPTYDVRVTYSTPVVAPNALCTMGTSITADTTITGENTATGGPRPTGTNCGGGSAAKALYYAVTVPPGQEVAVTTDSGSDLVLFEQAACADTACTISSDFPESLTVSNVFGTSDVTRVVAVRGYSSASTYDITFTYATPVVAPNASCAAATPITTDATITGEDTATGGPRATGTNCGGGSGSRALYYAVTIPAGQQVAMTTDAVGDMVVFEQAACADTGCAQSSDFPEALTLSNVFGTSDVTRIVGVRGYSSASTYDITFTYSTPVVAANASCTAATVITANTTVTGEDTETGGPRSAGTNCGNGTSNKALYYAVTIPAGQAVTVQATPASTADLLLFEQTACGDSSCVGSVDDANAGAAETRTLTNTGTSDVVRILGVRGYNAPGGSFAGGVFDITFTYSAP